MSSEKFGNYSFNSLDFDGIGFPLACNPLAALRLFLRTRRLAAFVFGFGR